MLEAEGSPEVFYTWLTRGSGGEVEKATVRGAPVVRAEYYGEGAFWEAVGDAETAIPGKAVRISWRG